jgi:ubiquinol-cytochrome c reductase cytochrome c subunit
VRRLILRWLTHRSRVPRWLRGTLAVALGAGALLGLAGPPSAAGGASPTSTGSTSTSLPATHRSKGLLPLSKQAPQNNLDRSTAAQLAKEPRFKTMRAPSIPVPVAKPTKMPFSPGAGNPIKYFPDTPILRAQGFELYHQSCASCHGMNLQGTPHVAPALIGVGAGPVDFYLSTGRMPAQFEGEPERATPVFSREQMNALIAFIASYGGPPAPTANPSKGDISTGQQVFTENCAGCHQIVARGGMTVGAVVPNLLHATPEQIAEAVRFGPYLMPHFDATDINQHDLDSLTKYILYAKQPDNAGGWGIYNIGPIPEGLVAWFMGLLAILIVARLIGERTA